MDQEAALFPGLMKAMAKSYGNSKGGLTAMVINAFLGYMDAPSTAPADPTFDRISCGPEAGAAARRKAGVPAWRYRWFGEWPNLEVYPKIGAYHSMDCPIVFGATERTSSVPDTPEEAQFVKNMMTAWATFAKDPDHGLEKLGWPLYDPKGMCFLRCPDVPKTNFSWLGPTLVKIGYKNNPNVTFGDPAEYDKACSK